MSQRITLFGLLKTNNRSLSYSNDRDTSNKVVRLLDLKNLRAIKPDVVVGLNRELVIVRTREGDRHCWPLIPKPGLKLYILTRRVTPPQSGPYIEADVLGE